MIAQLSDNRNRFCFTPTDLKTLIKFAHMQQEALKQGFNKLKQRQKDEVVSRADVDCDTHACLWPTNRGTQGGGLAVFILLW